MNYIKSLHIEGFKKFQILDVPFNEHMNILVGENEAGKSTILDAIKIVLNQKYRFSDKSVLRDLFNVQMVKEFEADPTVNNLPRILIEIELILDPKAKNADYFYGEAYGTFKKQVEKFGIRFECKYDELLGAGFEQSIQNKQIPYEYYSLTWTTFANNPYQTIRRPFQFLAIDTTSDAAGPSFNSYNRTLFTSRYDDITKVRVKNDFRTGLIKAFNDVELPELGNDRKFGVDTKKVVLETILSVYEGDIALENRGSGMESLIKTEIALEKANGLDVILMEEPENHLSFTTLRKMLHEISTNQKDSQLIVTTHNNMIASRLNLNNVLWITEDGVKSLSDVDKKVAAFFVKADNNAFLQLLLSNKIFLVEGATEFLLLPHFYEQVTGKTIEEDGISVISCNGISFKNYIEIAKKTGKKIAVITDNDGNQSKINNAIVFNEKNTLQHIFMSSKIDEWTWEVCLYNLNELTLDNMIKVDTEADYLFHNKNYGQVLGKMLNNKVEIAYNMLLSENIFKVPQYLQDAIKWLRE